MLKNIFFFLAKNVYAYCVKTAVFFSFFFFFFEELGQLMHFPAKYIYEAAVL